MKRVLAILIAAIFALSLSWVFAFADEGGASEAGLRKEINAQEQPASDDDTKASSDKASVTNETSASTKKVYRDSFTFDYSCAAKDYDWCYKDFLGLEEGADIGEYTGKLTERDYIENECIVEPDCISSPISGLFCGEMIGQLDYETPQNSNPKVFGYDLTDDGVIYFKVNGVGTTTLTYNLDDVTYMFDITVEQSYYDFFNKKQMKFARASFYYGESYIKGFASKMNVIAYIGGKKCRTIKTTHFGDYAISVKGKKIKVGQSIKVVFTRGNYSKTQIIKVKSNTKAWTSRLYYGNKKITIKAKNLHKGDKIRVKIGKKTYTYKIKKNYKSYKSTKKIKKHLTKYGNKYTIKVYNKYGQKISSKSQKMYYSKKIKKGMTKRQVKSTVEYDEDFGKPESIKSYKAYTAWRYWYDEDSGLYAGWIIFRKGKVIEWYPD